MQQILSGQQLAFERLIESKAVERVRDVAAPLESVSALVDLVQDLDRYHEKTFDLANQEAERLGTLKRNTGSLLMVGCGAFSHTLLHACLERPEWDCTGIDYDNSSLVQAATVRERLGLGGRLHFQTHNGHIYDYSPHDVVLIANIVTTKDAVLRRVASTARRGAMVIVRNPVTFGEVLWEDSRYHYVHGLECIDRFDSNAFGECFETVVFEKRG